MKREDIEKLAEELSKKLTDKGKLIEAGWIGYKMTVLSPLAGMSQIDETRTAFFAGAQHLFSSILSILEPGADPTEKDLERMTLIHEELKGFLEYFKTKHNLT